MGDTAVSAHGRNGDLMAPRQAGVVLVDKTAEILIS